MGGNLIVYGLLLAGIGSLVGAMPQRDRSLSGTLPNSVKLKTPVTADVIGGTPTDPGAWPWMVALTTAEGYFVCGASLVTAQWLVSAAHCFPKELRDGFRVFARIGAHNLTANDELVRIEVTHFVLHPQYTGGRDYDIAMLKMRRPVNQHRNDIAYIKVPPFDITAPIMTRCYITGWGATDTSSVSLISDVLTQMQINILTKQECQARWAATFTRPEIYDHNICIDEDDGTISACFGDSGGPLQCFSEIHRTWVILGVSSWGSGACHSFPSVYTRTVYFQDWMQSVVDSYKPGPPVFVRPIVGIAAHIPNDDVLEIQVASDPSGTDPQSSSDTDSSVPKSYVDSLITP